MKFERAYQLPDLLFVRVRVADDDVSPPDGGCATADPRPRPCRNRSAGCARRGSRGSRRRTQPPRARDREATADGAGGCCGWAPSSAGPPRAGRAVGETAVVDQSASWKYSCCTRKCVAASAICRWAGTPPRWCRLPWSSHPLASLRRFTDGSARAAGSTGRAPVDDDARGRALRAAVDERGSDQGVAPGPDTISGGLRRRVQPDHGLCPRRSSIRPPARGSRAFRTRTQPAHSGAGSAPGRGRRRRASVQLCWLPSALRVGAGCRRCRVARDVPAANTAGWLVCEVLVHEHSAVHLESRGPSASSVDGSTRCPRVPRRPAVPRRW